MKISYQKPNINTSYTDNVARLKVKQNKYKVTRETEELRKPARAISFGGFTVSAAQKLVTSKSLNKLVDFVYDNEAAYNAIYSLFIAGMIKPVLVLNTKGSEEKDKQIIATKNFLQAFIGSFLGYTIGGGIIKKAVDVMKNDLSLIKIDDDNKISVISHTNKKAIKLAENILIKENSGFKYKFKEAKLENNGNILKSFIKALRKNIEYKPTENEIVAKSKELVETCGKHRHIFEKNPEFIKEILSNIKGKKGTSYKEAYEVFWKNSTDWITTIGKAKISSLLLPGVLAYLFTKKVIEKQSPLVNTKKYNDEKQLFKPFNKENNNDKLSFKGSASDKFIQSFAKGVENLSVTKTGEKMVKLLANTKKPSPRMGDVSSILLTLYWLRNTSKSKKIDPDQKLGLNIQTALVTIVSSIMALLIDTACDKPIKHASKIYKDILSKNIENIKNELSSTAAAGKKLSNEEMLELIKTNCSNLGQNKLILNTLSNINLKDSAEVDKAINDISKTYGKKLSKFKSLTIFTFVVRLLVPVLMVPVAGKIKKYYKEHLENKKTDKTNKK